MSATELRIFGKSFERSRTIAFALFTGMATFIAIGVLVGGPVGTILAAIGSTLGTTALVSFLYDPFLKEILAKEIFERVGLRDSIVRAGLEDIAAGTTLDIAEPLAAARRVRVMPLDPIGWTRESFSGVLDAAVGHSIEVVIVLPSPDESPARKLLSRQLRLSENELERQLKALPEEIAAAWDRASVASGSTLEVRTHERFASTGLFVGEPLAIIETGPSVQQSMTDRTTLVQRFRRDSLYGEWIAAQLQEAIEAASIAAIRPTTPASELPNPQATAEAGVTVPREEAGVSQSARVRSMPELGGGIDGA